MINLDQDVTGVFANDRNKKVFEFLKGTSAHYDVAEMLAGVVKPLEDVQVLSPDLLKYRYIVVATLSLIFGFARDMDTVAFRLEQDLKKRALDTGGRDLPAVGREWVYFRIFRDDWPDADLDFWARQAYRFARNDNTA